MSFKLRNILIICLLIGSFGAIGQELDRSPKEAILKKENSGFMEFRSNGWGFGYRTGKFKTGYKKKTWDFSFSVVKDIKQYKVPPISGSFGSRYYYGKMIHFYNFKALYGLQSVVTTKPYWGGVEIRKFLFSGLNIGVGVPIYVYVYNFDDGGGVSLERFDPVKHDYQDIYNKGPFSKGLKDAIVYPSLSFKGGINVEYGLMSQITKVIEVGGTIDIYPIPVQIMALKNPSYALISIYVGFHFGQRYNR